MTSASSSSSEPAAPLMNKAAATARIGIITRELHDALRALGAAPELQRVVREMPDTRNRLSYVGEMTEQAAHRVLNLVDAAMPAVSAHIARSHREVKEMPDSLQEVTKNFRSFADDTAALAVEQKRVLSDIMMAQDFQDLSGQVIKKVIDMISRTERQLVQLLIDEADVEAELGLVIAPGSDEPVSVELQGPQTPGNALQQDDVDDLLASLGF